MLTEANFAANLKTAALNAAASAGVTGVAPSDWTLDQRTAYNKALTAQILSHPGSFSAETLNIAAATNTDYGFRGNHFDTALEAVGGSIAGTAATLNPFDVSNIGTVAKWFFVGALALLAFWVFLRTPPRGPSAAPARA